MRGFNARPTSWELVGCFGFGARAGSRQWTERKESALPDGYGSTEMGSISGQIVVATIRGWVQSTGSGRQGRLIARFIEAQVEQYPNLRMLYDAVTVKAKSAMCSARVASREEERKWIGQSAANRRRNRGKCIANERFSRKL